jgi:glycerol-3-phosphate dehydrogenase
MVEQPYDLLVIGGGVNGAAIARDAAGRGLLALLCEQGDLAQGTSSATTKLLHGGLRYLEHRQFRLVRESLRERRVLWRSAPHLVEPLRFVLVHRPSMRPAWMIRLGLFLYDHIGGRRRLPGSRRIDLATHPCGGGLKPGFGAGFVYSDCRTDDARLVVLMAVDAAERGAEVRTRTRCRRAVRDGRGWRATLEDARTGRVTEVAARAVVNAAGPWVDRVAEAVGGAGRRRLRLVRGSHIVVPALYAGDHAFVLQQADGRIVFAIPFADRFTLVGTTEVEHAGDPAQAAASPEEVDYLCRAVRPYLASGVRAEDVVWSFSGVRPLFDEDAGSATAASRDYALDLDAKDGAAPLLSVLGGKLTTCRALAENALERLVPLVGGSRRPWTRTAPLPGGDMADVADFFAKFCRAYPWLPLPLGRRLVRAYGTRAHALLEGARALADLGADLGGGLHEREVEYLARHEWAETADDILWRRSKLGLGAGPGTRRALDECLRRSAAGSTARHHAHGEGGSIPS